MKWKSDWKYSLAACDYNRQFGDDKHYTVWPFEDLVFSCRSCSECLGLDVFIYRRVIGRLLRIRC